ncbi:P-loop containing nucleoside triphosphate hydrolase protein [Phlyctochytrium arcticum]|nr:P-loop containing nucleoside triphosphate hydrolase protein [Phlyctochytrium arcticum]
MDKILIPGFFRFVSQNFPDKVQTLRTLLNLSDLTSPADAYTETRKLKRKLILHVGPTNSGKTYAALQRFIQSNSGIYCGPLRLLAHEVYERMNAQGVPCNLVTGEERRQSDGVDKYAATVEMAPQNVRFDVAIIDEIQMIGDKSRGWAWTHALLGLQADEIHLCGEPTVIPLINALAKETGDEVEINYYDRLTQLTVKSAGLSGELRSLRKGDCIVSFSRQNIFAIKRAIEEKTALRAAVIYGSLPPETRAEQARLFNDPDSPYDVLVASDAIGMGLNLNIRRLIFERVDKWNGETTKKLTISETKQIAGRAGRFGTQFEAGEVCTLDNQDMRYLHQAMRSAAPNVMSAGLHPSLEQLESFAKHLPKETFSSLLERFEDLANLGGRYFLCNLHNLRDIAKLIEKIALTLRDRYVFVLAPTNVKDPISAGAMTALARAHSNGTTMLIGKMLDLPESAPTDLESLRDLEAQHRIIILYMWLAQRFPDTFVEPEATLHFLKRRCEELINLGLASLKFQRKSRKKKKNVQTTPPVDLSTDSDMIDDAELSVSISNDPDPYGIYETDDPSAAPLQNLSNVLELCGIKKSETDRF